MIYAILYIQTNGRCMAQGPIRIMVQICHGLRIRYSMQCRFRGQFKTQFSPKRKDHLAITCGIFFNYYEI